MTPHASLTESRGPPQMPPQHSQQPRSHSPVPPQQPRADSMVGAEKKKKKIIQILQIFVFLPKSYPPFAHIAHNRPRV
jgi:hypothetical protein